MIRAHRSFLLVIVLALALSFEGRTATLASAQVATGTPPFGSFGGGPEVINLANLNAHWTVPILHKPGRGINFTYDLSYDSSVWYPVGSSGQQSWQPVASWGWAGATPQVLTGQIGYSQTNVSSTQVYCGPGVGYVTNYTYTYGNWQYMDRFGIWHQFAGSTQLYSPMGCNYNSSSGTGFGATATDGSGYQISAYANCPTSTSCYAISSDGTANYPSFGSVSGNRTDRNGNQITVDSSGHFYDTLSSTTAVLTGAGSGTTTNPMKFTYTAPSGASPYYQMNYTNYTVATNFAISGISEYRSAAAVPLVSSIVLPDNSQYSFLYEPTPGTCAPYSGTTCVTARIHQVTLPTGGTITYSYSGGSNGILPDGSTATLTRTTPDGTWTYAQVKGTGFASTTTITDPTTPTANQTVIQFQGIYETQSQVYQGSTSGTLLRTWTTCYNGNTSNCPTTAITLPITQRTVTDQYGSNGLQCSHNYLYNTFGGLKEQDDYDYGSPGPGALLRKTLVTYASLGNITAFQKTVTVCNATGTSSSCNGPGTPVAQTNYNYDETTPTATSGVVQHVSVTGSRGNLTSINYPVSGLTSHFTYWDTGSISTSQDVNGATTTYNYPDATSTCGNAFPTSITEPVGGMSQSMTWNCTGAAQLTSTDENSKTTTVAYNDAYFWRKNAVTDQLGNQTSFSYQPNPTYCCPTMVQSSLTFNNGNSVANDIQYKDGLGRTYVDQRSQSPGSSLLNSVSYTFDPNGRPYSVSMPCAIGYAGTCSTPTSTQTYDALNRPLQTTDGGGGYVSYSYYQNDVLVTTGPVPSGENTKRRQLEYDALGQLASVCELTNAAGSGGCGQNSPQTGYLTTYTYDALGNLLTVTQNAQPNGTPQTRSYIFDGMSRLTSETNPESGTTTYAFDSATGTTCAPNSPGDLIKRVDANGNWTCYIYDALHRLTDIGNNNQSATNPCKRFRYDNSSGYPGSTKPVGLSNTLGRLIEAATDVCNGTSDSIITDEWFSYTARGEISDAYESTLHSGGYYHVAQSYWPHGSPYQLSGNIGLPTITYGADGEGRISIVSASSGQNPVTGVTYNNSGLPTQVTFGSADTDIFAYDPNTMRTTQYQFNINGQSSTGALTWNGNSTLQKLVVTDPFNSADNQTCNYIHDDLSRIAQADCATGGWGQSFAYDPFGNITKSVLTGHSGNSFQPTYNSATNRFSSIPGASVSYDANGNVLGDGSHTYAWDAYGNTISLDGIGLTFDALDRMVEQNRSGTYTEIVYSPGGGKLALMSGTGGQTLQKAFIPLPGQAIAVYTSTGLDHYRHSDWLGSARLTSSPTRTVLSTAAYAPYGETYAQSGSADLSFTGQNTDTVSGDYDFLYREYSTQGRWTSPDPAGLAAVDPTNPQSWSRYAYVTNDPLDYIDPYGLFNGPCGPFDDFCSQPQPPTPPSCLPPFICGGSGPTPPTNPGYGPGPGGGNNSGPANNRQNPQPQPPKPCYGGNSRTDKAVRIFSLLRLPETWKEWVVGGAAKISIFGVAKAGARSAGGAESLGAAAIGTGGKILGLVGSAATITATMADIDCHIGPVEPYTEK
jgi:RHS repeat-associated protein